MDPIVQWPRTENRAPTQGNSRCSRTPIRSSLVRATTIFHAEPPGDQCQDAQHLLQALRHLPSDPLSKQCGVCPEDALLRRPLRLRQAYTPRVLHQRQTWRQHEHLQFLLAQPWWLVNLRTHGHAATHVLHREAADSSACGALLLPQARSPRAGTACI